jgi:hypothetical protein
MNIVPKPATVGAAAVLAAATIAVSAAPAQAASYNGACGSGYTVIDHMSVGPSGTEGTTYLTYNHGWNCVVTITNRPGTSQYIEADLEVSGGSWKTDWGYYKYYAGPVYVYAPNKCVDWGGWIGGPGVLNLQWNDHCG